MLTCSDSRVPTELVFDQGFGDLFVVRVAGNVCDTHETASIEYGAGHLGTPMIVVLGHAECGAVTAVAMKAELSGSMPALVHGIQPAVDKAQAKNPDLTGKALVPSAVRENVFQSMEDLLNNSQEIRELVKAGKVKLVGAQYEIATGRIRFLGEHPGQAKLLAPPAGKPAAEASARTAGPAGSTH